MRMDVAALSEICRGREEVRWAVGNGRIPMLVAGAAAPLDDTVCKRLLDGTIDSVVPDASADPRLRDLPVVRATGPVHGARIVTD